MKQEIVFSGQADTENAVQELVRKLKNPPERYNAVIFFASSDYDFESQEHSARKSGNYDFSFQIASE